MDQHVSDLPATSSAATSETEPEVLAGISSAEGSPDIPTDIKVGGRGFGTGGMLVLLAAGVALGFGVARCFRDRG